MSSSPALLIDELHNAAVADYLKSLSDTPTVREATVAPEIVVIRHDLPRDRFHRLAPQ